MPQMVNITFHGLCMFVPSDDGRMYVLMPETGGATGDGIVGLHHATLEYDRYAVERASVGARSRIEGMELKFGGMPHGGAVPMLPRGVVNVSRYAGTGVPHDILVGGGGGAVAARVVLTAGRPGFTGPLASRTFVRPGGPGGVAERVEMADVLTWTVEVDDGAGPVTIRGRPLDRGPERVLATFRADIPCIDLRISCALHAEPGTAPAAGDEAQQLRAYSQLLAPHRDDRLPRIVSPAPRGAGM